MSNIADKAVDAPLASVASTIRSLKPGDRVRVTKKQSVVEVNKSGSVWLDAGNRLDGLWPDDPTITSIEVIERPLQVGDRVVADDTKHKGTIVGLGAPPAAPLEVSRDA